MLYVSDEYRKQMSSSLRPEGFVKITFGIINLSARENSSMNLEKQQNIEFIRTGLYDLYLSDKQPEKSVFTFEKERYKVSQKQNYVVDTILYDDYIIGTDRLYSDSISNENGFFEYNPALVIDFSTPQLITGLRLFWDTIGMQYAKIVKLHFNDEVLEINNDSIFQEIKEISYEDVSTLKIEVVQWSGSYCRARYNGIEFGIYKEILKENLAEDGLSYNRSVDVLSNTISYSELNFTMLNTNEEYNLLNPNGFWKSLQKNQEIKLEFGRLINGEIEWVKTDTLYYDGKATSDGNKVNFKAVDVINAISGDVHFPGVNLESNPYIENHTGKEVVESWISQATNEVFEHNVNIVYDEAIEQKTYVYGIPQTEIKTALQLMANANKCSVYSDTDANIIFKNATDPKVTLSDNGHMSFSDLDATFNDSELPTFNYVQFLKDYYNVNNDKFKIIPKETKDIVRMGFVSDKISNEDRVFETQPMITVSYSLPTTIYEIPITFDSVNSGYATDFRVLYYYNNELVDETIVTNNTNVSYTVLNNVEKLDKFEIIVEKWDKPYRRCVIDSITNGRVNDFYLTLDQMLEYPKMETINAISKMRTFYYTEKIDAEFTSYDIDFIDKIDNYYYYEVFHEPLASVVIPDLEPGEYYGVQRYATYTKFNTSYVNQNVLSGKKIETTEKYEDIIYSNKGESIDYKNPLITNKEQAIEVSKWLYDYVAKGQKVSISYRGNPEIQPLDIIYIQTKFGDKIICRVMSNNITVTGGMRGTMEVLVL